MQCMMIHDKLVAYRHRPGLARTIVFANSLGSDQTIWDEVIAALPGGYGVLTYDLPGHGLSTGQADSIEGMAADLSALIDALGLTDVLFCGVSIGGMIGQVLAARRPDMVRAAVFCNTASVIGSAARWEARIAAVKAQGTSGVSSEIVGAWFGSAYAERHDRLTLHETMIARTSDDGYIAACSAIRDADLTHFAEIIDMPVLCVGGAEDTSVPPEAVQHLARSVPGAQMVLIDGVGHLPCLEAPSDLARRIEEFDPVIESRPQAGHTTRSAVLGADHVARAEAGQTALDHAFQTLITEGAWGTVWSSPGLSARERSMLTLALLAATGNFEEIPMHIRAMARTGATERDIAEAFQHVAIYAGVPKANHALKLAKRTLAEGKDTPDE